MSSDETMLVCTDDMNDKIKIISGELNSKITDGSGELKKKRTRWLLFRCLYYKQDMVSSEPSTRLQISFQIYLNIITFQNDL
ncbi:hypothetical protein, partial [Parabacteroides sp.]